MGMRSTKHSRTSSMPAVRQKSVEALHRWGKNQKIDHIWIIKITTQQANYKILQVPTTPDGIIILKKAYLSLIVSMIGFVKHVRFDDV